MAGEFKQVGLDYRLIIEREGEDWYFTIATDSECLWGGNLQSLVETLLFSAVAKEQLLESMATQGNNNPTVLLQALSKSNPAKAREFMDLISAGEMGVREGDPVE